MHWLRKSKQDAIKCRQWEKKYKMVEQKYYFFTENALYSTIWPTTHKNTT